MNRQDIACFGWGPCYVSESWRYTPQTPHIASHFWNIASLDLGDVSKLDKHERGNALRTEPNLHMTAVWGPYETNISFAMVAGQGKDSRYAYNKLR